MYLHRKWPLVVAVSSAIFITGCLGGGGGSSGSGEAPTGSGGNPDGVPGTATPGEEISTATTYTVVTEIPQLVGSNEQAASNLDRLVATISQVIAPYAQAQTMSNLRPADVRVALMRGDNNGTPGDITDDVDLYLTPGQDYSVEVSDGALRVELPFRPRVDHFIEIVSSGMTSLRVPTYRTHLVADPVSTFITHMLSSRATQLNQLSVEEVDELLEEIRVLAAEPEMNEALLLAYASSNSTQALIDALSNHFFAIVDARLEDSVALPIGSAALLTVDGEYYFQSIDLGSFTSSWTVGLLGGGTVAHASLASTSNGNVRASVAGSKSSRFEAVHEYSMSGGEVRVEIREQSTMQDLSADSRGLTAPQSFREVPCFKADFWTIPWIVRTADCMDQQVQSQQRLIAAGPSSSPFSTIVGNGLAKRRVGEANEVQFRAINGSMEMGIKKPNLVLPLSGEYGVLEITHAASSQFGIHAKLIDATHAGQEVRYCERAYRGFSKAMSSDYQVDYFPFDNDDCSSLDRPFNYNGYAYYGPKGELGLSVYGGYSSADGLTYMGYRQTPDDRQMAAEGQTRALTQRGERGVQIAVKRDMTGTSLANKRYRLISVGAGASQFLMEADRFLAGTLTFDDSGHPTLQAAVQSERILDDRSIQLQPNSEFNHRFHNFHHQDGRLWMSIGSTPDDVRTTTTLTGYVQQGSRLLLMLREVVASDGYKSIGPVLGVCMNCD